MATKVLCDCGRPKCGGVPINGHNAGREPVIVRSSGGFRFQITCLGGPDGGEVDLRPGCVHAMVCEGDLVREPARDGLQEACEELGKVLTEERGDDESSR